MAYIERLHEDFKIMKGARGSAHNLFIVCNAVSNDRVGGFEQFKLPGNKTLKVVRSEIAFDYDRLPRFSRHVVSQDTYKPTSTMNNVILSGPCDRRDHDDYFMRIVDDSGQRDFLPSYEEALHLSEPIGPPPAYSDVVNGQYPPEDAIMEDRAFDLLMFRNRPGREIFGGKPEPGLVFVMSMIANNEYTRQYNNIYLYAVNGLQGNIGIPAADRGTNYGRPLPVYIGGT